MESEILDLIEQGSYVQAQQQLARKIKKFPQRSYLYALNNQVLHKLGKSKQALENNLALSAKNPNDPLTLSSLYEFFTEIGGHESEANAVYENVLKKYPTTSLPALMEWFEKSIGKYDLKLYSKIFTFITKNNKDRLYIFWHSFCYLCLITKQLVSEKETTLFKTLGLKLIESLAPFQNTQELYVYFKFLVLNGKLETLIEQAQNTTFPLDLDLQLIYLDALVESSSWKLLHETTERYIFKDRFNDYDTWKLYVLSGHKLGVSYQELYDKVSTYETSRNSLLILVELSLLFNNAHEASVTNYFEKYSHKVCCFPDLKNYISHIETEPFLEKLQQESRQIVESSPSTVNDLIKLVNIQKFVYYLTKERSADFLKQYVATNWRIYSLFKDNTNIRGGEFDYNPLNQLTIASIIIDVSNKPTAKTIVKNIAIITHLLKSDEYNHSLKLWLIKLLSNLNATNLIISYYNSMNIKMLQHDTLSHLLIPTNPSKDHLSTFITIFRFYLTSNEEVRANVLKGFNLGTFNKLQSFINFGARINNSVSKYFVILTILRFSVVINDLGYVTYFLNYLRESKFVETELVDNRDTDIEWKSTGIFDKNDQLDGPRQDTNIKLELVKYLIMFEDEPTKINAYMKQYNKLLGNSKDLFFKLDQSILKLYKQKLNASEQQSNINYLIKNLKFDKIKTLLPAELLNWQTGRVLVQAAEFIKAAQILSKRSPANSANQQLKPVIDQLIKDIKAYNFVSQQKQELAVIKDELDISELAIDTSETFKLLGDSISESSSFLRSL